MATGFEHYMYIVPMKIKKLCPELAEDDDFMQECYLNFLEFTQKNKNFNAPEWYSRRATLAHNHIEWYIKSTLNKRCKEREIPSGLLIQNMRFCDIEKIVFTNELRNIFNETFSTITEREQSIIEGIYYKGKSYRDLAKEFGCTPTRISQIERKVIEKLRHPSRAKRYRDFYK